MRGLDCPNALAAVRRPARLCGLCLISALLLHPGSAGALPRANGTNCKAEWVNNAGAMACFIQGEEDVRNGAAHPHYVACTNAGEIFCCVDNDQGQDCEAVRAGGRPPGEGVKLGAILDAQQTILTTLNRLWIKLDKLESRLDEVKRKCPP